MNKYNKYFFFEEDNGGDFGGAAERFEPIGESEPAIEEKPVPVAKPDPESDRRAFAKEIGQEFAGHLKTHQEQTKPVPQMSPAEAKKALKVWEPDDAYFQRFDNLETRKAAFEEMRDRLVEQADTIAQARMYQMQQSFDQRLQPALQYLTKQETKERETEFYSTYASLDKPSIRKYLPAIASQMANEGKFNGLSQSDAYAVLAQGVEAVIKETTPEFKLTATKPNLGQSNNSLSPVSVGSGGGGGNGASRQSGTTASKILGPVGASS